MKSNILSLTAFFLITTMSSAYRMGNFNRMRVQSRTNIVKRVSKHPPKILDVLAVAKDAELGGDATLSTSTFNLAKNIIGAGVLSLPSGVALISDSTAALVPSSGLTILMGLVSAYSFSLIGRACAQHKTDSFQDTWAKSVDPKTAWMISAGITAMCFLSCLAYSIIIGEQFYNLLIIKSIFKTSLLLTYLFVHA